MRTFLTLILIIFGLPGRQLGVQQPSAPSAAKPPAQAAAHTPAHPTPKSVSPGPPGEHVPAALHALSLAAQKPTGWAPLARYAESATGPELKGLAFFTLGYRELQAQNNDFAELHFNKAAATRFSLTDYAEFYRATAAVRAGDAAVGVTALNDFSTRFPSSALRIASNRLRAECLIGAKRPDDAVKLLEGTAGIDQQPLAKLLLAQAYGAAGRGVDAVRAYQAVYYGWPVSNEAAQADLALIAWRKQLGAGFPQAGESLRTARASGLETAHRYAAAFAEFEALRRDFPSNAANPAWRLARDRCLVSLARANEALSDLAAANWPAGSDPAERALARVRAASRANDESTMLAALDELSHLPKPSPQYTAALDAVTDHYRHKEDWAGALPYARSLAEAGAPANLAAKADWEVTWGTVLTVDATGARPELLRFALSHPASPRASAVLYWIARMDEESGRDAEARLLYGFVQTRFRDQYYSLRAAERLKASGRAIAAAPARAAGTGGAPALPESLAALVRPARPVPSVAEFCAAPDSAAPERSASELAGLGLDDLAASDLRMRIQQAADPTETLRLRLDLARAERVLGKLDDATYDAKRVTPGYTELDISALPAEIWDLLYPRAFWALVRQNAAANRLDPYLVMALIRQESGFNASAVSGPGARGLMQVMPPTARDLAPKRKGARRKQPVTPRLDDPAYNIRLGCRFLKDVLTEFNGNLEETLAAYNAGPGRVHAWLSERSFSEPAAFLESIPIAETRDYVQTVLRDQVVYRRLLGENARFKSCPAQR